MPALHFVRAIQGGFLLLFVVGALVPRPWFLGVLEIFFTGLLIFFTTFGFLRPAPLISSP